MYRFGNKVLYFAITSLVVALAAACSDDDTSDTNIDDDAAEGDSDAGGDTDGDPSDDATPDTTPDEGVDGAETSEDVGEPEPEWCNGTTAHRYDPLDPAEPDLFPDGLLVRADDTSPTGWRLDLSSESAPWTDAAPDLLKGSLLAMNNLSGFGSMGGTLLRFSAPVNDVPLTSDESVTSDAWQWWDLDAVPPERVPFEARVLEDGLTVVLWPLRPLRLATEHAIVVTTEATADDGDCIAPAPTTRALLHGAASGLDNAARIEQFAPSYRDAIALLGIDAADVSVLSVYSTHDDLGPIRDAAEAVVEQDVAWGAAGECETRDELLQCEGSTTVLDYRNERGVVDGSVEPREGSIPVTYWIPPDAEGPLPVIVYGHGLNSERDEGYEIAQRFARDGFAVIAMEAVEHGEHPFIDPAEGGEAALRFLGIDLANARIDADRIMGNFNQTSIDRLRLIELIRQDGDIDGDGVAEFDGERVAYIGVSLGALCGTSLIALSPDIDAAVFTIGGARLMSIVTDTELVATYRPLIAAIVGSAELFDRLVPIAQHVVDAADPGTWAAFVLNDRLDARTPPSLLVNFGMSDEVVPPSSGRALARALGLPHLAPVEVPVDLVDVIEADEVTGNLADGERTAAFFQYTEVTRGDRTEIAGHTQTAKSDENAVQIRAFLIPWANGELPVIVNPFAVAD